MRILGIDPGLQITGYACIGWRATRTQRDGDCTPELIEAGVLRFKAGESLSTRLVQLRLDLDGLLDDLKPTALAIEKLFSHYRHARTAIIMGHARGVVLCGAAERSIAIHELAPTEIKRAIGGHGHASKSRMQRAVMDQCGLKALPEPPDVADAIAIALCAARRLGPSG